MNRSYIPKKTTYACGRSRSCYRLMSLSSTDNSEQNHSDFLSQGIQILSQTGHSYLAPHSTKWRALDEWLLLTQATERFRIELESLNCIWAIGQDLEVILYYYIPYATVIKRSFEGLEKCLLFYEKK